MRSRNIGFGKKIFTHQGRFFHRTRRIAVKAFELLGKVRFAAVAVPIGLFMAGAVLFLQYFDFHS